MVQLIQALEEVSSNAIHFFLRIVLFLYVLPLFFSSTISRHSLSPFNTEKVSVLRNFSYAVTATLLAFELPKEIGLFMRVNSFVLVNHHGS